ncbi:MAG: hypothetical protein WC460_06840 [Patescibacteria group bacterium]
MPENDVELFTIRARLRLLAARKKKTGLDNCSVCDNGFMHGEGFSFSDKSMLFELRTLRIDVAQALKTPAPNEEQILNSRYNTLAMAS